MATIQVRNVPDDVHQTYQRRAKAAGKSLQEYLLAEMVYHAGYKTPAEIVAEVRADMSHSTEGFSRVSSADVVRADRDSH